MDASLLNLESENRDLKAHVAALRERLEQALREGDERVQLALADLRSTCAFYKVLGSYPAAPH